MNEPTSTSDLSLIIQDYLKNESPSPSLVEGIVRFVSINLVLTPDNNFMLSPLFKHRTFPEPHLSAVPYCTIYAYVKACDIQGVLGYVQLCNV